MQNFMNQLLTYVSEGVQKTENQIKCQFWAECL